MTGCMRVNCVGFHLRCPCLDWSFILNTRLYIINTDLTCYTSLYDENYHFHIKGVRLFVQ